MQRSSVRQPPSQLFLLVLGLLCAATSVVVIAWIEGQWDSSLLMLVAVVTVLPEGADRLVRRDRGRDSFDGLR